MAIATSLSIKYKCGHTQATDLSAIPAGRRKSHAYGLGKNGICGRCFSKDNAEGRAAFLAQRNAQALAEAESFENDHQIPPLTGSEKQLSWGTRTRYELLSKAFEDLTVGDEAPNDLRGLRSTNPGSITRRSPCQLVDRQQRR
jgi:hypothetical protein